MASRGKKLLIGCAVGCGALLLVAIVLVVGFFAWLRQPGEPLEPRRLLGRDTTGYVEWTLRWDDPGTEQFVTGLVELSREHRQADSPLPAELEGWLGEWRQRNTRRDMERLFPVVAAWTMSPGPAPADDRHLFSVSARGFGNQLVLVDFLMGLFVRGREGDDLWQTAHGEERIFRFLVGKGSSRRTAGFFIRRNHLFISTDPTALEEGADRMAEETGPRPATALEDLFALAPPEAALRGALANDRGEVARVWERLAARIEDRDRLEVLAGRLRGAILAGDLAGPGTFRGQVSLLCPDPEWAAARLEHALQVFRDGMEFEALEATAFAEAEGEWIRIDFTLANLPAFLERYLRDATWKEADRRGETIILDQPEQEDALPEDVRPGN